LPHNHNQSETYSVEAFSCTVTTVKVGQGHLLFR